MGVNWDMAAFYAALAIFAAPNICKAVLWVSYKILHTTQRMPLFEWEDIPEGKLHHCPVDGYEYSIFGPDQCQCKGKKSDDWGDSIRTIFNVGWESHRTNPRFVDYVPDFLSPRELHSSTKRELELILAGYPPWYREEFFTNAGFTLSFPLSNNPPNMSDVVRGGWVVAVGPMQRGDSQRPLTFYRCPEDPEGLGFRENGLVFRKAIKRCLDHSTQNIQPHFLGDDDVATAVCALEYMLREKTGSGVESHCIRNNYTTRLFRWEPIMPRAQCEFIMTDFNEYKALGREDRDIYKRVLVPAMAAVIKGSYEVIQYLKDFGTELKIPAYLQDWRQEIYLVPSKTTFRRLTS
ncbi:hypothetical protein J7T55_000616 [Diaporthe amygdali]|uniref:uncharacterized protein n=1 Tax=Phomopsis amygdali TaxID=1214568 RepID=UPI0022FDFD74|nr:uncharacterized protein J7T55_000616 [Diaporthe amygdali]KAJ0110184.1 hypothetical protein J7T55_000616 [Diaporthe amygdali]